MEYIPTATQSLPLKSPKKGLDTAQPSLDHSKHTDGKHSIQ